MTGTLTLHGLKGTADIDYGTTLPTSPTTGQIFFQISDPWYELPPVNSSDNGKILTVVSGQWTAVTKQNELPSVSSSDNGKVLSVVNGAWTSSNSLTTLSNNLGNLSSLTTTTKTSAVAAINEVKAGVDTNSDAIATINGKLTDTGWTTINTTYPTYMRVKNGFVTINMRLAGGSTPPDGTLLYTLPAAYRPALEIAVPTQNLRGNLYIKPLNGEVSINANSGQTLNNYMAALVTYPI